MPLSSPLPVVDLHCDLLSGLLDAPTITPQDPLLRCAFPQLAAGRVMIQTCALFAYTGPSSPHRALAQVALAHTLLREGLCTTTLPDPLTWQPGSPVTLRFGIENLSAVCDETEPLDDCIARLDWVRRSVEHLWYVGLTWGDANRFGGGNSVMDGLTDDGRRVLDYLATIDVPVDLSHTSDATAHDIFSHIDRESLPLRVLASHSNARAIAESPRNLPDELLAELGRRGGIVGVNWIRFFVGDSVECFFQHLQHLIHIAGPHALACGADFFLEETIRHDHARREPHTYFFPEFSTASDYPDWLAFLATDARIAPHLPALCYHNALRFFGHDTSLSR